VKRPAVAAGASLALALLVLLVAACAGGHAVGARGAAGRQALSAPGCATAVGSARRLPAADVTMARAPGSPFGIAVAPGGRWAFVALGATVGVFRTDGRRPPALVRQIAMPSGTAMGLALAADGRYLLVADDESGAVVLSVAAAATGAGHVVAGVLSARPSADGGAIEVAVTPGGRYAFVSNEDEGYVAVFNLQRALADGFGPADYVGAILTGVAPVGLALSPDGRWLYVTSEAEDPATSTGSLAVINVAEAEAYPAGSVVGTVPAGCNPVRVIASADGSVVWVAARGSDALLAFSAAKLRADPGRALLADVRVGELPVGLALVRDGSLVVVADSNRYNVPGATSSLAVVDVADALAGRPALVGYLPAGGFPREMALEPGGATLLVTNDASGQVEAVDVAALP
jgi:DNA-binding beta-propeller fold protein YncE